MAKLLIRHTRAYRRALRFGYVLREREELTAMRMLMKQIMGE